MTPSERIVRAQTVESSYRLHTNVETFFPDNNTKCVSSSVTLISTIVSVDNYGCSSWRLRCVYWWDAWDSNVHWEFIEIRERRSIDRSGNIELSDRRTEWIPILDLTFPSFRVLQLGWWQLYDFLTNSMIIQHSTRNLRNAIDRDRKFLSPNSILMKSDEVEQSILREYTPWKKKKTRSTIACPVDKFQSSGYSLLPCHSDYGQVVDQHRKSPSIWFHAWNPNVKRFRRPVRMTGKVFPHLSINHVPKIFRYHGSSEHRVNQVRETFSIGCQKTWNLKQKTRNQKSSFLISHLFTSSELCRAFEASSGKPQKGGHDEEWRWRKIRDYIHEVRDFLLLP